MYWNPDTDCTSEEVFDLKKRSEQGVKDPNEYYDLLREPLYLEEATEPTDIIWESLESVETGCACSCKSQNCMKVVAFSLMTLFVAIMFGFFFWLKIGSVTFQKRYPPGFDCKGYSKLYGAPDTLIEAGSMYYLQA